jgi:hypothetical protein
MAHAACCTPFPLDLPEVVRRAKMNQAIAVRHEATLT